MKKFGSNTVFTRAQGYTTEDTYQQSSTIGVAIKTIILIGITFLSAIIGIYVIGPIGILQLYIPIVIIDFILLLIMSFNGLSCKYLSIPYAILEGLMVGAITGILEIIWPGVGISVAGTAFIVTIVIFLVASLLYISGAIRVTNRLRKVLFVSLLSLLIAGTFLGLISLFSPSVRTFFNYGPVAIIISIVYILIASLYVVISLDNAYEIVDSGLDKNYEWYAAFGILINIIWLFYEVLRLIIIIMDSKRD